MHGCMLGVGNIEMARLARVCTCVCMATSEQREGENFDHHTIAS